MNCAVALELLLEADLDVLRGSGDDELARHLAGCARCREATAAILAGTASLAGYLEHREPARRRARLWRVVVPLTMAAAAAAILMVLPGQRDRGMVLRPVWNVTDPSDVVVSGRNAAIMQTANPDITVIWLF